MDSINEIIVIFKTHLDIGFTGLSADIIKNYNESYIPKSIAVGEKIAELQRPEGFVWTTGSWLIHQYLKNSGGIENESMRSAIRKGFISWHGLPFTMHSEYTDAGLYRYGLGIARRLDEEFAKKTIAAKNTDVPGSTRCIVPHLFDFGVEFLHVGVNPAAFVPDVPDIFRWRCPEGKEIIVMYNKGDYGEFTIIPGTGTAVYFAHTGDNMGPQAAEDILKIYNELHEKYPGANIRAGDLNDLASSVLPVKEALAVVTSEIGDTWIHGIGTDPQKTSGYRALLRMAEESGEDTRDKIYEHLIMVPEHTWGLDEKTFLADEENYRRDLFDKAKNQEQYKIMERSWEEQRTYVLSAADSLSPKEKEKAGRLISEYEMPMPDFSEYEPAESNYMLINGWGIKLDENGLITSLQKNSHEYVNKEYPLGRFLYESFSEKDVEGYMDRYLKSRVDWALKDNGKPGLGKEVYKYSSFSPSCKGIYRKNNIIGVLMEMERDAVELHGAPPKLVLKIIPEEDCVNLDFAWFDKPANRAPEACWLNICFNRPLTAVGKIGGYINPLDVVSGGNREMHGTDGRLRFDDIDVYSYDASLLSVEKPFVYGFHDKVPDTGKGVWFNLFNNQWGTNFPMWNSGNARFRFKMTF